MKTIVMIPTYNERENIISLINDIIGLDKNISVVVVDDNSPDGTWKTVDETFKGNPQVDLIVRKNEKGRGSAGIRGFKHALSKQVDYIIEMDSDYSHHPKYIPSLISAMSSCDISIGSRMVSGGMETGRGISRRFITKFANLYIRLIMGVSVYDCTSGYRCFKKEVLKAIEIDKMVSTGPSIVEEILYACHKKGFKMKEIPIVFEERLRGESTKDIKQYIDTAWKILKFRIGS